MRALNELEGLENAQDEDLEMTPPSEIPDSREPPLREHRRGKTHGRFDWFRFRKPPRQEAPAPQQGRDVKPDKCTGFEPSPADVPKREGGPLLL